ncbi:hypothetical protein Tsubulata_044101 [Turnera subulata]|uniref:SAM domain-containing protein n=1 Tax=Turnera subulata TaxID=218843 RepID=A0A9Q0GF17_9ROSI|nr:hypothetical protein Tsubulata_044101 [Turnera subulata]
MPPKVRSTASQLHSPPPSASPSLSTPRYAPFVGGDDDDDDDFQLPLSQTPQQTIGNREPLKPTSAANATHHHRRPLKKPKHSPYPGKENVPPTEDFYPEEDCSLELIESSIDCSFRPQLEESVGDASGKKVDDDDLKVKGAGGGYLCNSIEARLIKPRMDVEDEKFGGFEESSELDALIKLCAEGEDDASRSSCFVQCPLCGADISDLSEESRLLHSNDCLDIAERDGQVVDVAENKREIEFPVQEFGIPARGVVDESPVVRWLRNLGLERYEEAFVREEIDWDSLQWLTEEDLFSMGVTTLGPRKKIMHALVNLRKECNLASEGGKDLGSSSEAGSRNTNEEERQVEAVTASSDETSKSATNKLITDYFPGSVNVKKKISTNSKERQGTEKSRRDSAHRHLVKDTIKKSKLKDIPPWCSIPGTPFRVDAFKYLRGDCCHWFLTHFHMDHYQGLTRSFCHGKIYCSLITAKLVNMKIGIPWARIEVLPLNQKICIAGVDVTCLDANHCPGSVIILFEPPNGKAVLHTGDFRFCESLASSTILQMVSIHTLILDTTYCSPQYDFPKQEAVIQFVIEAIQAEAFNPKTLFLIGSYTIGKERLFLAVARVLRRKVHVTAAKYRLLECLGFSEDDMRWFTLNEQESQIHVVPLWTLASFKRLKHISNQYSSRFSLIVAFSPTGWTFGKGKKKSPGRRWQQGTIIRYEVPYSEHSSFTELREFVKLMSPEKIIPSVNNDAQDSADTMISLLLS